MVRILSFHCWGPGSIPGQGTEIPQAMQRSQKKKKNYRDFSGGPVVKNLPPNAGDTGSASGWGTGIPHATGQLSPRALEQPSLYALEPAHHN